MRSTLPYQRSLHPDPVDKASAKKTAKEQDVYVDRPNADSSLNEAAIKLSGGSEIGEKGSGDPIGGESGHRPALELIMYILLGLFILIALIFAVNCGAMVARYRWEHAKGTKENLRLQQLSELAMSNANTDAAGMGECSSSSTADLQSQADQVDTIVGLNVLHRASFLDYHVEEELKMCVYCVSAGWNEWQAEDGLALRLYHRVRYTSSQIRTMGRLSFLPL